MVSAWLVVVCGLSLLVGMLSGAGLAYRWLDRRKTVSKYSFPQPGFWPLKTRRIFNSHEKAVWLALNNIFHDHVVMVKIPYLRFTQLRELPFSKLENSNEAVNHGNLTSDQWLEMLGGLYATFTVCTLEGQVVGCVDVSSRSEASSKYSREFKETLLLECDIAYALVTDHQLPDPRSLREWFLGELPVPPADPQATRGGDSDFHAEMSAFSRQAQQGG